MFSKQALNNKIKYLAILLAMIFSFLISDYLVNSVFYSYSPKVKNSFISQWSKRLLGKDLIAEWKKSLLPVPVEELKKQAKTIAPGIKTASHGPSSYTGYSMSKVKWETAVYKLANGKIVKIKYPKGTKKPPKELIEFMHKND